MTALRYMLLITLGIPIVAVAFTAAVVANMGDLITGIGEALVALMHAVYRAMLFLGTELDRKLL